MPKRVRDNVKGVMRNVVTYSEARAAGLKRYFSGKSCPHGHVTEKFAHQGCCAECLRIRGLSKNMKPEQLERNRARSRNENMTPEQVERRRAYFRVANMTPERLERYREVQRTNGRLENMTPEQAERKRAKSRKDALEEYYRLKLLKPHLKPKWANDAAIREVYLQAVQLTRESGVMHEVDHIVATQGREAVGFHTEANMRVIPKAENGSKSNKLDHDLAIDPYPPQCTLDTCRCGTRAGLFTSLV